MTNLAGKVAVVLGCSAERGTGWAIAETLAAHGAKVVVAARRIEPLRVLADRIGGHAAVCDVGDETQIAALAETARRVYGKVDVAVNSAPLAIGSMIADARTEDLMAAMQVNYVGNVHFVKHMAKAIDRDGSIVIISSSSAHNTIAGYFPYACAKAAADCMVRYAALEYGPRNIRVNSVVPAAIRSELSSGLFAVPGMEAAFAREVPLGRIGEPGDFANAVLWLAGPAYVTGLNLPVSGGNQLTRSPYPNELPSMTAGA